MTASLRILDAAPTDRMVTAMQVIDAGSVDRTVVEGRIFDMNGIDRVFFTTASTLAASASPETVSGFTSGSGTCTTNNVTVTPSGGVSPYTYAWAVVSHDSGVAPTADAPSAATTAFSQTSIGANEYYSATFRCTVTDDLGDTTTVDVLAFFQDIGGGPEL
jgi:hypothetical protein